MLHTTSLVPDPEQLLCSGTEDIRKIEQKMLLNVGLVKKRSCDFDWTDEVKNDISSSQESSEDETNYKNMPPLEAKGS